MIMLPDKNKAIYMSLNWSLKKTPMFTLHGDVNLFFDFECRITRKCRQ